MSPSSSPVKISNYKPLNPLATSYEPQSIIFFPLESPYFHPHLYPSFRYGSSLCWENKGEYLNLYDSEMQPLPLSEVFNGPKSIQYSEINYGFERINVGNRKKGKWRLVPPRLKSAREFFMPSQEIWVKKSDAEKIKTSSNHVHVTAEEQTKLDGKTSVMIKNVPNHFQRIDLQRVLDYHCRTENRRAQPGSYFCKSAYDFLYLPMDFGFHLNLGFAFVNFTSPVAALRFYKALNNQEWSSGHSRKKICEIGVAKFQGKDALKENFQYSVFPCHTNKYLPVVYSLPRDGFNSSRPTLVGRRSHVTATSKDEKVMIMTQRKNKKEV